jgi:hypothetical protein
VVPFCSALTVQRSRSPLHFVEACAERIFASSAAPLVGTPQLKLMHVLSEVIAETDHFDTVDVAACSPDERIAAMMDVFRLN